MFYRLIKNPKVLIFTPLMLIMLFAVACGSSAEPVVVEKEVIREVVKEVPVVKEVVKEVTKEIIVEKEVVREVVKEVIVVATPIPAASAPKGKPTVSRYVESQGEIQQETNLHCAGNRPIISQFLPYVEFLVEADPETAEMTPWLAASWETSADGRSWTFHLREEVPFHHGRGKLTSKDFAKMAEAKGAENCASSTQGFWKGLDRTEIIDDHTFTFHMKNPSLPMLAVISNLPTGLELFSLSADQVDEVGYDNLNDVAPSSTSYYQYVERKLGESVIYERVPYEHWRFQAPFEEMEIRWIGEESTRMAGLLAGEIHAIALSRDLQATAIEGGMKIIPAQMAFSQLSLFFGGMYFMPGDPDFDATTPWADIRVRQAMNKAVNREELNKYIFNDEGERMHVTACCHPLLDPEIYNPDWETRWDDMYGYDPDRARELLAEAGYSMEKPVKVTILNYRSSGEPESPLAVEALPQYWGPVGIEATIRDLDTGAYSRLRRAKKVQHMMWANVFSFRQIADRVRSNAPSNTRSHTYDAPFMEEKWQELSKVTTQKESDRIGREVANFWYDDFWTIPVFWFKFNFTVNPEVVEDWTFLNRGYYWHNITPATK
jgi:ABC-type transport system substrate-binding protein